MKLNRYFRIPPQLSPSPDQRAPFYHSFSFLIDNSNTQQRLDMAVVDQSPSLSRSSAAALIQKGFILVSDQEKKPSYRVRLGDCVSVSIPPQAPIDCEPEPIPFDVLYEDEHLTIINKPPGIVVHPAPGNWKGTLVAGLLYRNPSLKQTNGDVRPGIVHRLDRDTSGVMITTRSSEAHMAISEQFKSRFVEKVYFALVHSTPALSSGSIDLPIGRHPVDRKRMAVNTPSSRNAETDWKVLSRFSQASLLQVRIHTGRTHQIRVHMQAAGHPVLGDIIYCRPTANNSILDKRGTQLIIPRQMLHAAKISFRHPVTSAPMTIEAPIPGDMAAILDALP